jgi:hypothetical protein
MKELLIFLLLIFFIEVNTQNSTSTVQKATKIIPCSGGRVVSGVCKCPSGTKYYSGKCSKQAPVKCVGGKISNNNCVCPQKTKLKNGVCTKV